MGNLRKIGGLSAILYGIIMFASFILITLSIVSMPSEAMQMPNAEARLAFAATLPDSQRFMLTTGFGLELLLALLLLPLLLALYSRLKDWGEPSVMIGTGLGAISIPFLVIEHLPRFSWLALSARYLEASVAQRAIIVETYAQTESLGLIAESVFWLFFASAVALYAGAMFRAAFPRWLALFGLLIACLALFGAVGSVVITELGLLEFAAFILFGIWSIGVGSKLYREGQDTRLRPGIAEATTDPIRT
jgi:hypothetical protein